MKLSCAKLLLLVVLILPSTQSYSRDHLIYTVAEDLPMGFEGEILRKNYYINMGSNQGVKEGTILDVFRVISKSNPYDNKKRVNYKVKVGELEILHTEESSAIAISKNFYKDKKAPLVDINGFMIGDHVAVTID